MKPSKVTVIDYGVGNLLSVQRGLEKCGAEVSISSDPSEILNSTKVVFPGVGAFPDGMKALENLKLIPIIKEFVASNRPLLAICLGMELLFDESNEFSVTSGLGLISGKVVPVPNTGTDGNRLKIPHIGWAELQTTTKYPNWKNTVLADIKENESTYFVHSYMAVPEFEENLLSTVSYGGNTLAAVVKKDNLIGCQFHPEKSGTVGLRILNRFCND
jgi:imidazole glycerol-phosphate synthase subunit HisH